MGHTRNGKAAKIRRQETAQKSLISDQRIVDKWEDMTPEEKLLVSVFGAPPETCMECGNAKLVHEDCQTPHCKSLRDEASEFYDSVNDDRIVFHNGLLLELGIDY